LGTIRLYAPFIMKLGEHWSGDNGYPCRKKKKLRRSNYQGFPRLYPQTCEEGIRAIFSPARLARSHCRGNSWFLNGCLEDEPLHD
jgi:hypothetical protein